MVSYIHIIIPTNALIGIVLILVVVDDGPVLDRANGFAHGKRGLNPCCSGRWSRSQFNLADGQVAKSLNPCCSGRWSRTW